MTNETGWIAWFVRNPVAANLLMIGLLLIGAVSAVNLRTEEFPAEDPNAVTVTVFLDGGSPEILEEAGARRVEEALAGVEGVHRITATATSDRAVITVEGVVGYPIEDLKDEVTSRVDAISTFPAQVEKVLVAAARDEEDVLTVQLYGRADHRTLKETARRVRDRLLARPQVNSVAIEGARDDEVGIEVSEEKLRAFDLTFEEVAEAVRRTSTDMSAGVIRTSSGRIVLQTRDQVHRGPGFRDIVVRSSEQGGIVRIRDVAEVMDGFTDQEVLSTFQGQPSVGLVVKLIGRDSIIDASDAVKREIGMIAAEPWFPGTLRLATWADEAESIRDSLALLSTNALLGMVLVVLLLALFLHPNVAFWVAAGIPVSFAGAFFVIGSGPLDYSINNLTIFAFIIALGIVVDDAIVIGESIYTHRKRGGDGMEATIRGARDVAVPATFGVLTTVAAFLPLAFVTGDFGGPFRMIAVVTIACLLFSLVESKLILPAHLARLRLDGETARPGGIASRAWRAVRNRTEAGLEAFVDMRYVPFVRAAVEHRYQALGVFGAVLILAAGVVGGGVVKVEFFGDDNASVILAAVKMPPGTPAWRTHEAARHIEGAANEASASLMERYGLSESPVVYSRILAVTDSEAEIALQLTPGSERPFHSQDILDAWRERTGPIAGAEALNFFIEFEDEADLRIELSSHDAEALKSALGYMARAVAAYDGVRDLTSTARAEALELDIRLRPEAALMGLTAGDVIDQVRNAVFGHEAQRIQRDGEEPRVMVRLAGSARDDVGDIRRLAIRTNAGGLVPLAGVADLYWVERPTEINRINGERVAVLTAKIDEDAVASSQLLNALERSVFPQARQSFPGVRVRLAGESEAETDAVGKLIAGFAIGLLAVYALLAVPLKSYIDPIVILLAVPYGIVGAIAGHLLVGIPVGLLSFFGIIALTGVVVNDALILLSRFKQLEERGATFLEAIVAAGASRFRAVMLTSITAFFGLLPLILETSEQARELIPMAVSLAFGILFATAITLLIVPVLVAVRRDAGRLLGLRLETA